MEAPHPMFVVGYQRSGTTLLQSLLGAHSRIAAPPEMHFILRVAYFADLFGDLADDDNLRRALRETLNPPLGMLDACGFEEEAVFERARAGPRNYGGLFAAVMDDYTERNGKVRWTDKTPAQRPDDIYNLFPDARIVHIVRDARNVVASNLGMPWERRSAVAVAADLTHFTLEAIERCRRAGPARYLQVRYEDLTLDPEAVLRLVCAFVGERYEPTMLDPARRGSALMPDASWQRSAVGPVVPTAGGKWREHLCAADRLRVQAVAEPLLEPFGYPRPSALVRRLAPIARAEALARGTIPAMRARRSARKTPQQRYEAVQAVIRSAAEGVNVSRA